jgi:hypothetical protein
MFISGNRYFCTRWALDGRIWILWVIKPTFWHESTEPVFHIERAFWFPRSLRIFCLNPSQWRNFLMVSSWVFVFWVMRIARWSTRPLRVIYMLLLAQRPIWTICWTATIGIIWSRWPIWILHEADWIRNYLKGTSHNPGKVHSTVWEK